MRIGYSLIKNIRNRILDKLIESVDSMVVYSDLSETPFPEVEDKCFMEFGVLHQRISGRLNRLRMF